MPGLFATPPTAGSLGRGQPYNPTMYFHETFTADEERLLQRFFTNTDRPVFALINLPEVVKGALFARYSRSPKSLRRLLLDEFINEADTGIAAMASQMESGDSTIDVQRAERLYSRVFSEYGDDSVAQLGGAHIACEQASNILTKILEWGRLAAYLEQSTRYIFYDRKLGDRFRYLLPPEVRGTPLEAEVAGELDRLFETYSSVVREFVTYFETRFPKQATDSDSVWRSAIRAKACDAARGLLPAATLSNVGVFASGQAYEQMLLRMRAHPLQETRDYADMMLEELRKVIPSFLRRVDVPERGGAWSDYFDSTARRTAELAAQLTSGESPAPSAEVTLVDWDPDAEVKTAAAALYASTSLSDAQLLDVARRMSADDRAKVIATYVGDRSNRRHRPGRGMERSYYRFDVLSDFGSFRDLQRHRMLTVEWQRLGTLHGYTTPPEIDEIGRRGAWDEAMGRMASLGSRLAAEFGPEVAQYVVPFAYRLRYVMEFNTREAFHMLELRTSQQGHPDYRRICQEMHRLIGEQAGHRALAGAMKYVDHDSYGLERIEAERRSEQRRNAAGKS